MATSSNQPDTPDEDHWEIYATYVDENPAIILVDVGIVTSVPLPGLTKLAWLRVYLQTPDEEGFPSDDEDDKLNGIEDALTEDETDSQARYVGRITMGGRRDFYFYISDFEQFQQQAAAALHSFPEYQFEIDEADDPEWSHYVSVLFPSAEDFQQINNQNIINRLYEQGDTLEKPRPVDHFVNFVTEPDRDAFITAATSLGYEAVSRPDNRGDSDFPYSVGLLREDAVDPETIDRVTYELYELAEQHDGHYEGWTCAVVK